MMPQYVEAEDLEKIVRGLSRRLVALETREPTQGAGIWIPFTATVTQSVAVSATQVSRFARLGNVVIIECSFSFTSAGVAGNSIIVAMPANVPTLKWTGGSTSTYTCGGAFIYYDPGTAFYAGSVHTSSQNFLFLLGNGTVGTFVGAVPSFAIAAGDHLTFTVVAEV